MKNQTPIIKNLLLSVFAFASFFAVAQETPLSRGQERIFKNTATTIGASDVVSQNFESISDTSHVRIVRPGLPTQCVTVGGSLTASDPTQTGRIFRDNVPDTCNGAGTCSVVTPGSQFHYDEYAFTNTTGSTQCVTVSVDAMNCVGPQLIFAAAYLGSFDPANICTNWIADLGTSPIPVASFSFNLGAGQTFILVISEVTANAGCMGYTASVYGICPTAVSAVSRKTHGSAGTFDVDLPLNGPTPGIECRTGGATNDFTMMVTFSGNVNVTGSPQAEEYNAGASRVQRWAGGSEAIGLASKDFLRKIDFPSTRNYVDQVLDRYRFYKRRGRM